MKSLRLGNLCFGLGLVLCIVARPALCLAETANPDDAAAKLDLVQKSLESSVEKQVAFSAEHAAALKIEAEISKKLIVLTKTIEDQQQALVDADLKLDKLAAEAVVIRSDLSEKQEALSKLLVGLQILQQNPPPALMVEPHDILAALRGAMMFGAVVPSVHDQAKSLQSNLDRLAAIKTETEQGKLQQQQTVLDMQKSQNELAELQIQKRSLIITTAQNLVAEKAHATDLANQAKNLKQLLASLEIAKKQEEAQKSAVAKAADVAERQRRDALYAPALPFMETRGKLVLPVKGEVLKQYGDDNGLGGKTEGMALAAAADAIVTSPIDAKVEFAGPFRSYGQLLILNAGEGYLVLLAGMKQISVEIGQSIHAGEPLGKMGQGPSSVALIGGETDNAHPVLYIEFRKNNDPVDPAPWWINSRKEAMK